MRGCGRRCRFGSQFCCGCGSARFRATDCGTGVPWRRDAARNRRGKQFLWLRSSIAWASRTPTHHRLIHNECMIHGYDRVYGLRTNMRLYPTTKQWVNTHGFQRKYTHTTLFAIKGSNNKKTNKTKKKKRNKPLQDKSNTTRQHNSILGLIFSTQYNYWTWIQSFAFASFLCFSVWSLVSILVSAVTWYRIVSYITKIIIIKNLK